MKMSKKKRNTLIILGAIILIGIITGAVIYSYNAEMQRAEQAQIAAQQALDSIDERMTLIEEKESTFTEEQQTDYEALKEDVSNLDENTSMDRIQLIGTKVYMFYEDVK